MPNSTKAIHDGPLQHARQCPGGCGDATTAERNAAVVKSWHVLTHPRSIASIRGEFAAASEQRRRHGGEPVEYFLPTCYARPGRRGTQAMEQRKMMFTYLFVRDSEAAVRDLCAAMPKMRLVTTPGGDSGRRAPMTVPDREMAMFRAIADAHAGQLPCFRFGDIDLEEGDLVQVVGGPFDGVEGRLRCAPGRAGGQVVLPLGNLFVATTGDIAPHYLRIIEFGRGNRHPYRQFELHRPRAAAALEQCRRGQALAPDQLARLQVFARRYELLRPSTPNLAASHAGLMLLTHAALSDAAQAARWRARCEAILPHLTAPRHRARLQAALQTSALAAAPATTDDE